LYQITRSASRGSEQSLLIELGFDEGNALCADRVADDASLAGASSERRVERVLQAREAHSFGPDLAQHLRRERATWVDATHDRRSRDAGDVQREQLLAVVEGRLHHRALLLTGDAAGQVAHQLARALSIPREQAQRIARDELGEPVVVAGKILRVPRDALYRILMFVNPAVGHSVERVHALAVLYDEIVVPAAEEMLAIWQALHHQGRPAAKHQPLAWDDEAQRSARPAASVLRHPAMTPRTERRNAS